MLKKGLLILLVFLMLLTGCQKQEKAPEKGKDPVKTGELKDGTYSAKENGYGGELEVKVEVKDKKIVSVKLGDHHETQPVSNRALPVLEKRIVEANSPIVDSVTGATFTSFAVKKAVAAALKEAGQDFGEITTKTEKAAATPDKKLEDVSTDLLIIGGGPSGLAAAIEAKANGVENLIVIEKLDILSGNGKFDMNFFDLLNSKAMKEAGNEVSKEEFIKSKEKAVDSPERKQVWADGSWELDEWLRKMDIKLDYNYGGKGATNHLARKDAYAGEEIQDGLEKKIAELKLDVRTGTKATELLIENNEAKGAKVQTKYGNYTINAKAVIVATGGFSHNKELLKKYAPKGADTIGTSNQMGATGDLVPEFEKHGLKLGHMDILTVFNYMLNPRRDLTGNSKGFIVNSDGQRFVDSSKTSLDTALAVKQQKDGKAFLIYDQENYESFYRLQKHVKLGYHQKAETIEELAKLLGINEEGLKKTIEDYNAFARKEKENTGKDLPFGKDAREFNKTGPYYGALVESAIHMTKGGVVANEKAQVLTKDDKVVKGLYASGEVTDTTGAYAASIIWGRVAGANAAKELKK